MTRKYSDDIRAEIATLVPDNTTGQVTPAGVRQILNDIVDSFTQAWAVLRRTADIPVNLTTTPTKLVIFDEVLITSPELVASAANDTIRAVRPGFYNFNFTCSISGSNNFDVAVELMRNGTSTFWRALQTATGTGNRVELTLNGAVASLVDNDEFSIYVSVLSGVDNATFYDTQLIMGTVQTDS